MPLGHQLELIEDDRLPATAWCLEVHPGRGTSTVRHGPSVERIGTGVFEGAWCGPFGEARFEDATTRAGTGVAVDGDGALVVVPPSHPMRGLSVVRSEDCLLVSNSLVYVLAAAGATPRINGYRYQYGLYLASWNDGIPALRMTGGTKVDFLHRDPARIGADLRLQRRPVRGAIRFDGFEDYRDTIVEVLGGMAANATSTARRQPLTLLSMVSNGYDSPATTALGTAAGWDRALTLSDGPDDPDDGVAIGEAMGVEVERCAREAWTERTIPEAEFLASGGPGAMVKVVSCEPLVNHSLLLTGSFGDWAWSDHMVDVKPRFVQSRAATGVNAITEWELRTGLAVVPVPCIGAEHPQQFLRITRSADMDPWRVGGEYDRPIARRLIEEAGVPRGTFAVEKLASSHIMAPKEMTAPTRADFQRWLDEHPHPVRRFVLNARMSVANRVARNRSRWRMRWDRAHVFHWAVDRTLPRYESAIQDR